MFFTAAAEAIEQVLIEHPDHDARRRVELADEERVVTLTRSSLVTMTTADRLAHARVSSISELRQSPLMRARAIEAGIVRGSMEIDDHDGYAGGAGPIPARATPPAPVRTR